MPGAGKHRRQIFRLGTGFKDKEGDDAKSGVGFQAQASSLDPPVELGPAAQDIIYLSADFTTVAGTGIAPGTEIAVDDLIGCLLLGFNRNQQFYAGLGACTGGHLPEIAFSIPGLSLGSVIGRLAGDGDVVDMAFTQAGIGDAAEHGVATQIIDGRRARVAHRRTQTAGQLVNNGADRTLVRDRPRPLRGQDFRLSDTSSRYLSAEPRAIAPSDPMPRYIL